MVIYIHGFGSSGFGKKAQIFRDYFKEIGIDFIAPSLSYVPELAITTLEELIENCPNPTLIGSSLGGFYSIYLANKYNLKSILINPAVIAPTTLKKHIEATPYSQNYYDLSSFEWNSNHLSMIKKYIVNSPKGEFLLMLQKGDEVLDYKDALNALPNAELILEDDGDHSFKGIERHFNRIKDFLTN